MDNSKTVDSAWWLETSLIVAERLKTAIDEARENHGHHWALRMAAMDWAGIRGEVSRGFCADDTGEEFLEKFYAVESKYLESCSQPGICAVARVKLFKRAFEMQWEELFKQGFNFDENRNIKVRNFIDQMIDNAILIER